MADEPIVEVKELTDDQKANLQHGRTADLDAAAKKQQEAAALEKANVGKDQATIDAENKARADDAAAKEAADKLAADKAAGKEDEPTPDPDKTDDGKWKEAYVKVGNEHADAAIELMEKAGVKPVEANEVFAEAIKSGDLADVKWELLEARLGKAQAALVRAGVERYYETEYKEQTATKEAAFAAVNGEENWNKLKTWAGKREASDPAFAQTVANARKAIALGGEAALDAVNRLKTLYEADPKNSGFGIKKVVEERKDLRKSSEPVAEPLSRVEYFRLKEKAHKDRAPKSAMDALYARRQAGIASGI